MIYGGQGQNNDVTRFAQQQGQQMTKPTRIPNQWSQYPQQNTAGPPSLFNGWGTGNAVGGWYRPYTSPPPTHGGQPMPVQGNPWVTPIAQPQQQPLAPLQNFLKFTPHWMRGTMVIPGENVPVMEGKTPVRTVGYSDTPKQPAPQPSLLSQTQPVQPTRQTRWTPGRDAVRFGNKQNPASQGWTGTMITEDNPWEGT